MAKFKVPGVYIKEILRIPKFTGVGSMAVFIGYTEKHIDKDGLNLKNIPTLISSLNEFENCFGRAQAEENIEISDKSRALARNIKISFSGDKSRHNLYYSLKLFFANGGRKCKIVSAGIFKEIGGQLLVEELITALSSLQSETASLLITVPENQNLSEADFYLLQKEMLEFCDQNRNFAFLDIPPTSEQNFMSVISDYRAKLHSSSLAFGATFFPNVLTAFPYNYDESKVKIRSDDRSIFLSAIKNSNPNLYREYQNALKTFCVTLPPSPAVAAVTIKNDIDRGLWKTPANIAIMDVSKADILINSNQQEPLNIDDSGKSINCIRHFSGKGNLIWGSRTLDGNSNEWRYIPVRRFANQIEKDISARLQSFVFELNSSQTWTKIKAITEDYLYQFWKSGALIGTKPEQAYFVKCGLGETMTAQDLSDGNLVVQIGVAFIKPAEFTIFKFTQKQQSS